MASSERAAAPNSDAASVERLLRDFLAALERRELAAASALLAPGTVMVFPGDQRYTTLEAMVEASKGRYRSVGKHLDAVEVWERGGGPAVAYVFGTLHGVNVHGVPFEGVRFVDRFEVEGGRITAQQVFNDLAESGVLTRHA
jgi:ketosteroid isomerase-like protein